MTNVAFAQTPDAKMLQAAGVIASWIGTFADHRGAHFPVTVGRIPRGNVIAFVTKDAPVPLELGLSALSGPSVALRDNPADQYAKVLIVYGDDEDQLLTAARAVGSGRYPREGDMANLWDAALPPPRKAYDAPRWLSAGTAQALGDRASAEDLTIVGSGSANVYFRLPPDMYFGRRGFVPLDMRYQLRRWPGDLKGELHVRLNGSHIATRKISPGSDSGQHSMRIGLPVGRLLPANTLTLEFALDSSKTVEAGRLPEERILRDSSLDLSGLEHFVEMPKLELLANAGYPFTRFADLAGTTVIVPNSPTEQQISLYLSLLGFFGAQTGYPALRVTVSRPQDLAAVRDKDILLIGANNEALGRLIASSPVRIEARGLEVYPSSDLFARLPWSNWNKELRRVNDLLAADPAPNAFISEYVSPYTHSKTVVSVQAVDTASFASLEDLWSERAGLDRVSGNICLLQGNQLHSFAIKSHGFDLGDLRWEERVRTWTRERYWLVPIPFTLFAMFLALQMHWSLERRARLRVQTPSMRNS